MVGSYFPMAGLDFPLWFSLRSALVSLFGFPYDQVGFPSLVFFMVGSDLPVWGSPMVGSDFPMADPDLPVGFSLWSGRGSLWMSGLSRISLFGFPYGFPSLDFPMVGSDFPIWGFPMAEPYFPL